MADKVNPGTNQHIALSYVWVLNFKWLLFFDPIEINIVTFQIRFEHDSGTTQLKVDSVGLAQTGYSLCSHLKAPAENDFTSSQFKQTSRWVEMVGTSVGELHGTHP